MGTIESKIKNGYKLHHRPLFSSLFKKGVKPLKYFINNQIHANSLESMDQKHLNFEQLDTQSSSSPNDEKLDNFQPNMKAKIKQYPFCCVGVVTCFLEGEQRVGTGFLIDGNKVLTCAHIIYSPQKNQFGKNISFILSFKSSQGKNIFHAKELHIPDQFKVNNPNEESIDQLLLHNYAVIELDSPNLQQDFGSIGFNISSKKLKGDNHIIVGYDKTQQSIKIYETEQLTDEQGLLKYNTMSCVGMSGAPILQIIDDQYVVVGVHAFCRKKNGAIEMGGVKFSEKLLNQINNWCTQQQEEIDLRDKNIGKDGLKYLSKHKWKKIVIINLSRNNIQSNCAKYLKRGQWNALINFDLGGNKIGKNGAEALIQSDMTNIMTLNLWGNEICKQGAYFLTLAKWSNLTNLNLYNNDIGDEGAQYLSHANWEKLNSLNLGKNQITNEGAYHLSHGEWPQLSSLNLWGNSLSSEQSLIKQHLLNNFRCLKFLYF